MKPLFALIIFIISSSTTVAQVYDQSSLLNKMPKIPQTIVVREDEIEVFESQIQSTVDYLDSLENYYKHPMCSFEKSNQQELFEFNEIWRELDKLQDEQFKFQIKIDEQIALLSEEEFAKNEELSEKLRKVRNQSIKSMNDISGEENMIDKQKYDNHLLYSQKKAELLVKSITHYRRLIEDFSAKSKRADTILLAAITDNNKYPCAAITNAKHLLLAYKGFIDLFMLPYSPKF